MTRSPISRSPGRQRGRRLRRPLLLLATVVACLVAAGAGGEVAGPRGIYVLGRGGGDLGNIRDLDFVSGFTLRIGWEQVEPSAGHYEFGAIDEAVARLQAIDQRLTLELFAVQPPAHVMAVVAESWFNPAAGSAGAWVPLPWDGAALDAWRALMAALADHPVADAARGGVIVPFAAHPTLATVDAGIVGLQGLRELSNTLVHTPGYERGRFVDAVAASVHASRDAFPDKAGFIAFFRMSDGGSQPTLDRAVFDRLMDEFNGAGEPTLGLFQENLSDAGPQPGGLGQFLVEAGSRSYVLFQALTSWTSPFTGHDKVASGHPATGLAYAFASYGARYVELYVDDIDNPALTAELRAWSATYLDEDEPDPDDPPDDPPLPPEPRRPRRR